MGGVIDKILRLLLGCMLKDIIKNVQSYTVSKMKIDDQNQYPITNALTFEAKWGYGTKELYHANGSVCSEPIFNA